MERRKVLFAEAGVKNLVGYNNKVPASERLPRILVIIEESATTATSKETYVDTDDFGNEIIRSYASEFNRGKTRVKKEARFAGIYIIDSTQSPRREVLEPNYRGQFSCFLAFRCSRPEESKIALANQDEGACKLLGKGDALYLNHLGLERIQSLWVTDQEIEAIVNRVISTYGTYADWVAKERKRTQESRDFGETPRELARTSPNATEVSSFYEEEIPVSNSSFSSGFNSSFNFSSSFNSSSSSRQVHSEV
jgi:DNA segregation ATPase FtsK/SpoIIIE-like protein